MLRKKFYSIQTVGIKYRRANENYALFHQKSKEDLEQTDEETKGGDRKSVV